MRVIVLKDITITTQSFLFYFHCRYYNKYLIIFLQIKSSLVFIINYSIILTLKKRKNHTDNALGEVFLLN